MEPEANNKSTETTVSRTEESVIPPRVTAVATGWILDFMFVSLCRHFKDGNFDAFDKTVSNYEAICPSLKGDSHDEKNLLCAFLNRVMHGMQLDVQFVEDENEMPLMSAAKVWSNLKPTVADESVFKSIHKLLLVQSVAVCLNQGKASSASSALDWFEKNLDFPQNLIAKLSTIVKQRETEHVFLTSFSFDRLLKTIEAYLDVYLEKNPSDYLLKKATKMVQSSPADEGLEDVMSQDIAPSEEANKTTNGKEKKEAAGLRTKRKLMSTKYPAAWKPDSCKKPLVSVRKISQTEISGMTSRNVSDTSRITKKRKPPQKWTPQLDKFLVTAVKRHGLGKWSRMLMDFDFEGRTGTMLKDRWRVLLKTDRVG